MINMSSSIPNIGIELNLELKFRTFAQNELRRELGFELKLELKEEPMNLTWFCYVLYCFDYEH